MTKQITLEEALELVSFEHVPSCGWQICDVADVKGDVCGHVRGHVFGAVGGDVFGAIEGDVDGSVGGDVNGTVHGKINGRKWKFIETHKEKLQRLLDGVSEEELLKLINQLENN